jgi:hypothetical protein
VDIRKELTLSIKNGMPACWSLRSTAALSASCRRARSAAPPGCLRARSASCWCAPIISGAAQDDDALDQVGRLHYRPHHADVLYQPHASTPDPHRHGQPHADAFASTPALPKMTNPIDQIHQFRHRPFDDDALGSLTLVPSDPQPSCTGRRACSASWRCPDSLLPTP